MRNKYIPLILFICIIGLFYYNTFRWLFESWINNQYYSHGFLVPIVSGYIIWKMKDGLLGLEKKESNKGLVLFIVGVGLQIIAALWTIHFLSGISLIVTIIGTILYIFGESFLDKIKFPILFLLLAIPIPFIDTVALPAQTISVAGVTSLSDILGLPVQREGFLLKMPVGTFEVALQCSGLNAVISLLTISIIYAFILEGSLLMKTIIVLSSIPLAMMANILRITLMLEIANTYGQKIAIDYFHQVSDLLLFTIALIGLFLVGRCFGRLKFKNIF